MGNKLNFIESASDYLHRPVDSSTLGTFRFFFGVVMTFSALKYYYKGWIKSVYLDPPFHFTYEWFSWVTPWPGDGMYYQFAVMGVASFMLAIGLFSRFSALVFFLSYTYIFLLAQSYYNNHFYFICLVGFLLCIVNTQRWMSVDSLWKKKFGKKFENKTIPYWNILLLKAQVFIVYFYGGVAKLELDWLKGEPMRLLLEEPIEREGTPAIISRLLESDFAVYFFSYSGILFDLSIGFLLIYKKTRLLALGMLIFFNLTNQWLFEIGVFPVLMITTTILFLEPDTPRKFITKWLPFFEQDKIIVEKTLYRYRKSAMVFVSIYLVIQISLPFRQYLYRGHTSWTEQGGKFSWRMMLRVKSKCDIKFIVTSPDTGTTWSILLSRHLTRRQYYQMCTRPNMILQYAHFLRGQLEETGTRNPIIKVKARVSLNNRPPQDLIDQEVDLTKKELSIFKSADWILPLKE